MKILPLANNYPISSSQNSNINFNAAAHFTKKSLLTPYQRFLDSSGKGALQKQVQELYLLTDTERSIVNGTLRDMLKSDVIELELGSNAGRYQLKMPKAMDIQSVKEYILYKLLNKSKVTLGGLVNYISMVKDIKRQDIFEKSQVVRRGVDIQVLPDYSQKASNIFTKLLDRNVREQELFFIDGYAYCYDSFEKTIYRINPDLKRKGAALLTASKTKFECDPKGNVIGYHKTEYDLYKGKPIEITYIEQQEPSIELLPVVSQHDNKMLAEAFRFGNSHIGERIKKVIPDILKDLKKKVVAEQIEEKDLQLVKFYGKNDAILQRVCYYEPKLGQSFVYDEKGKFLYKMEYCYDNQGNITCLQKAF